MSRNLRASGLTENIYDKLSEKSDSFFIFKKVLTFQNDIVLLY